MTRQLEAVNLYVDDKNQYKSGDMIKLSRFEQIGTLAMKALRTFAGNCIETVLGSTSAALTRLRNDNERTCWVSRVVPVFQTFANQTGLLSSDWCEPKHYALADVVPEDYQKEVHGLPMVLDTIGLVWSVWLWKIS